MKRIWNSDFRLYSDRVQAKMRGTGHYVFRLALALLCFRLFVMNVPEMMIIQNDWIEYFITKNVFFLFSSLLFNVALFFALLCATRNSLLSLFHVSKRISPISSEQWHFGKNALFTCCFRIEQGLLFHSILCSFPFVYRRVESVYLICT